MSSLLIVIEARYFPNSLYAMIKNKQKEKIVIVKKIKHKKYFKNKRRLGDKEIGIY